SISSRAVGYSPGEDIYPEPRWKKGDSMNNSTQKQSAPAGESQQQILMPRVSVILATDTYETIRRVVERLRRQTVREQIEIVVIAPSAAAVDAVLAYRQEFAAVQIVE